MKDWIGNKTIKTLGATNLSDREREINDFYATDPRAIPALLEKETFNNVWECACGQGHLAKELDKKGILAKATDLIDRGYGDGQVDFLLESEKWNGDIITNPPFRYASQFIETAINLSNYKYAENKKVAMLLRIQFLEGKARKKLFKKYPPRFIYVFSDRLKCALNGNFNDMKGSAVCYAWFVWYKNYQGETIIKWL
jgi:hypothetical protein